MLEGLTGVGSVTSGRSSPPLYGPLKRKSPAHARQCTGLHFPARNSAKQGEVRSRRRNDAPAESKDSLRLSAASWAAWMVVTGPALTGAKGRLRGGFRSLAHPRANGGVAPLAAIRRAGYSTLDARYRLTEATSADLR